MAADDDNILEINALIDLSTFLPEVDEMVAATEAGVASMGAAFKELDAVTQLTGAAVKDVGLNDEELFGPATAPPTAAPTPVSGNAAAQKSEEAAAIEVANTKIQASEAETGDFAAEFENNFRTATRQGIVDAEEFAVAVSAATKKVADDLAELAAVARIQQAALSEAFKIHGDAAALGTSDAIAAISEQLSSLAVTKAQVDELKGKLRELAEEEVKQAAEARASAAAGGQAAESYGKTSQAALEAAAATQKLTEAELASSEAYAALIAAQTAVPPPVTTTGPAAIPVVDEAAIAASAAAFENYATDGELAATANQNVADSAAAAMSGVAAEVDAVDASGQAYLQLAGAQEAETTAAEANVGILERLSAIIQSSIDSLLGRSAATEAAIAAERQSAAAFANLAGAELEETAVRKAAIAVTNERAVAEDTLNNSIKGGINPRMAANQSLMVLEGTMRGGTRAAGTLLTEVLGLGPVFQFAFPIIGAIALVEILGRISGELFKVIDHAQLTSQELRRMAEETANLQIKADDTTRSLEAENLRLEDMISKIEGRPATNKLAIALIEIANKADALANDFQKDFDKIGEAIDKETTKAARFENAITDSLTAASVAAATLPFGVAFDPAAIVDNAKKISGRKEEYEALKRVQEATDAVGAARQKANDIENAVSVASSDKERVELSKQLQVAYGEQATAVGKLNVALSEADLKTKAVAYSGAHVDADAAKLAASLSAGAKQAASDVKDLGLEITRVGLTITAVQKEQAKEIANTIAQFKTAQIQGKEKVTLVDLEGEKQAAAAALSVAQESYKKTVAMAVESGTLKAQAELDALPALESAERQYATVVADVEKRIHETKVAALNQEITLAKTSGAKQGNELRLQLENLNSQLAEENARYQNQKAALAASAEHRITEDELREIQTRANAQKEALQQEIISINEKVAAAKTAAEASITGVKTGTPTNDGSQERIERVNQLYREGMITFETYQAQKIAAIQAEKTSLDQIYATERNVLQEQLNRIQADITGGQVEGDALRSAQKEYEVLLHKIQEVDNAQQKMAGDAQRQINQTVGEVSRYSLSWSQFFQKFNNEQGTMWDQFRNAGQQAFLSLDRGLSQSVGQLVATGRGFGKSMAQVWNQMVGEFAAALTHMLTQYVIHQVTKIGVAQASEATQTGVAAAGAAQRESIGVLADLKSIGRAAATAAAHAFKWVMEVVPFPANVVLAPAAAAAAFTGVLAFRALAGHAEGGLISGPGGPKSDSIVTRVSHGEYIVQAAAVNKVGVPFLNTLNKGFADGGYVGSFAGGFADGGLVSGSGGSNSTSAVAGNAESPSLTKLAGTVTGNRIRVEIAHVDAKLGVGHFLLKNLFGGIFGFAEGGEVTGAGGPKSDSVPARLSSGEFVVKAAAVNRVGTDFLNSVNNGVTAFAEGGSVTGPLQALSATGGFRLPPALTQNFSTLGGASKGGDSTTVNHHHVNVGGPRIDVKVMGTEDGLKDLHNRVVSTVKNAVRSGALNFGEI